MILRIKCSSIAVAVAVSIATTLPGRVAVDGEAARHSRLPINHFHPAQEMEEGASFRRRVPTAAAPLPARMNAVIERQQAWRDRQEQVKRDREMQECSFSPQINPRSKQIGDRRRRHSTVRPGVHWHMWRHGRASTATAACVIYVDVCGGGVVVRCWPGRSAVLQRRRVACRYVWSVRRFVKRVCGRACCVTVAHRSRPTPSERHREANTYVLV